ncbi:hypothetical protein C2E23DRAFT_737111 [Lenzites betulinus]|nr:hypothetical protein C2E23DRAFT_737111 [Lenzites betulinus]
MGPVYNVPMALDATLSRTEGLRPSLAPTRHDEHAEQARKFMLGTMPAAAFVDAFLPPSDQTAGTMPFRNAFNRVPRNAQTSSQIYLPLINALNLTTKGRHRCPGFVFVDTIERSEHFHHLGYAKPHISCFTTENASRVQSASKCSRVELGYAELFIDVSPYPRLDLLSDPPEQGPPAVHKLFDVPDDVYLAYSPRSEVLGTHTAFATEVLARQNRTFLFTVSVFGTRARLFRWDRAGCIVTEAFNIRDNPDILLDFMWRFSQASPAERGHDPTVAVATPGEEALFRDAIRSHARIQLGPEVNSTELDKAVTAHYEPGHASIVSVFSKHQPPPGSDAVVSRSRFIVSRPVVSPLHLQGRGSRGYWAVCADTGRVVFLKDSWRSAAADELEGDILSQLNEHGVSNVPRLVMQGDVPLNLETYSRNNLRLQVTKTDWFQDSEWALACRAKTEREQLLLTPRRHYRMVTDVAGYSLNAIRGTDELLHATYDAFKAMCSALNKASRIHRDLSVGNIILVREPGQSIRRGYLIDWESSDLADGVNGIAEHSGRAGTWEFMSIRMLCQPTLLGVPRTWTHSFMDDVESLFWVVLYCSLLYLPHDLGEEALGSFIKVFHEQVDEDGDMHLTGGREKGRVIAAPRKWTTHFKSSSAGLEDWLNKFMDGGRPRSRPSYEMKDVARLDAYWSNFLTSRTLETKNRAVHKVPNLDILSLKSFSPTPCTSPTDAEPRSRVRKSFAGTEGAASNANTKRARFNSDADGHTAQASPPRRSERILLRRKIARSSARSSVKCIR